MDIAEIKFLQGDCREVLKTLPDGSIHCCVTSPPYFGLRDYGVSGQIGLEQTPDEYVAQLVAVFREVRRVLRGDGTLWLNLGDSYSGGGRKPRTDDPKLPAREMTTRPSAMKPKDIIGIPWRVAFALQADGWYLRQDIIWHKPNPMPESVTDRCTKAHEYVFLLTKSAKYYYDAEAINEAAESGPRQRTRKIGEGQNTEVGTKGCAGGTDTRNKRSVWTVATHPYSEAHFATFPPALIRPMILAGCPKGGTVLDPFGGAGTTGKVSQELGRNSIMIELNPRYIDLQHKRTQQPAMGLSV